METEPLTMRMLSSFYRSSLQYVPWKEVELTGVEQKILSDICKGNRNGDQEEPIAKAAQELRRSANGTVHSSEWSNIDGLLWFRGKIYIPQSLDLRR